jgi:hypothetical protein
MYGSIPRDMPTDPRHDPGQFGAARSFRNDWSQPFRDSPQNLRASNRPSELNISNQVPVFVVYQAAVQANQVATGRYISNYTVLPRGGQNLATFGSV